MRQRSDIVASQPPLTLTQPTAFHACFITSPLRTPHLQTALYALTIVCIYFIKEPLPPSQRKTSVSWADANIVSVLLIMCRSGCAEVPSSRLCCVETCYLLNLRQPPFPPLPSPNLRTLFLLSLGFFLLVTTQVGYQSTSFYSLLCLPPPLLLTKLQRSP